MGAIREERRGAQIRRGDIEVDGGDTEVGSGMAGENIFIYRVYQKKALQFLSILAQSRCDPDLDHISIDKK